MFFIIRLMKLRTQILKSLINMYRDHNYKSRYGFCIFGIVLVSIYILLMVWVKSTVDVGVNFTVRILVGFLILICLIADLFYLRKRKAEKPMTSREEEFLRTIAEEKGLDYFTYKKPDDTSDSSPKVTEVIEEVKESSGTYSYGKIPVESDAAETAAENSAFSEQTHVVLPNDKDGKDISDLPSFTDDWEENFENTKKEK